MRGKYVSLTVPKNGGLYAVFSLRTAQDISGWSAKAYLYETATPTTAKATLTTAIDADAKTLTVSLPKSDVAALAAGTYGISVLVRPGLAYAVEFFYGVVEVVAGGPAWT